LNDRVNIAVAIDMNVPRRVVAYPSEEDLAFSMAFNAQVREYFTSRAGALGGPNA